MKRTTKHIGLLLGTTLLATPAFADSVFMLQFGSYQSTEEAQAHLDALKTKHIGALSRLDASVRPVTLPPDNLTVYRTQAGPLATRGDAQSVCSQLASNGDECYIVETASTASATPPVAKMAAPIEAAPTDAPKKPTLTIISAAAAPVDETAAAPIATDANDSLVRNALNDAVTKQNAPSPSAAATPTETSKNSSFWERINPFSSAADDSSAAKPAPVAALELPPSHDDAPVDAVQERPMTPPPSVTIPTPVAAAPAVNLAATAPIEKPAAPAKGFVLPPPPAPLAAKATAPKTTATPLPVSTGALPQNANSVRVEEAKRVPFAPPAAAPAMPAATPSVTPTTVAAVDLHPSATVGQRTMWAQISQFATPQQALAFWTQYRLTHPDFPVVRVRVTTPIAAQERGLTSINLRVGPFARREFITTLCTSITANELLNPDEKLRCGIVADLGVAVNPQNPGQTYLHSSRYKR